jgi:hypothetical protein
MSVEKNNGGFSMAEKINSKRRFAERKKQKRRGDFAFIAISTSVLAFLAGLSIAFFEPVDVHSQQTPASEPKASDPQPVFHLKREFIYLGSRLIAIDEAGSTPIAPDEPMVWSPKTGVWRSLGENEISPTAIRFGREDEEPFLADIDGDGIADRVLLERRNAKWTVRSAFDGRTSHFRFGSSSDEFTFADFDGDGRADIASFDSSSGKWSIRHADDSRVAQVDFGLPGDVACVSDFDGDGRADIAVWRDKDSTLNFLGSLDLKSGMILMNGQKGRPLCADFDGDGRADIAVIGRQQGFLRLSRSEEIKVIDAIDPYGIPIIADFDGDGRTDLATWNRESGILNVRESRSVSIRRFKHGQSGDIPLAGSLRR